MNRRFSYALFALLIFLATLVLFGGALWIWFAVMPERGRAAFLTELAVRLVAMALMLAWFYATYWLVRRLRLHRSILAGSTAFCACGAGIAAVFALLIRSWIAEAAPEPGEEVAIRGLFDLYLFAVMFAFFQAVLAWSASRAPVSGVSGEWLRAFQLRKGIFCPTREDFKTLTIERAIASKIAVKRRGKLCTFIVFIDPDSETGNIVRIRYTPSFFSGRPWSRPRELPATRSQVDMLVARYGPTSRTIALG